MAGYTRQSTFADGDTITAALFNNEYNQLLNAFSNTTGHSHDGTANEGPVIGLIGDAGVVTPLNKVLIDSTNDHIEFWIDVSSSAVQQLYIADGAIVPVTDNDIDLGTSSLQFKDLYINGTANIDSLVLATGSTVTAVLDEDDLSSDSATSLVTQQSVKAYIDAQVTAQDLDFLGDSGGALSIDLDSESLTIAGGTGLDTVGSGNAITVNIDATVATLTGSQTLTNKTIDVDNNTVSNIEVDNFKASAIVLESEGIGSNDNDTSLPTSAAVKDYVDTQITAEDLDITTDSGTIAIDLDSETLTVSGGTGLDSSATGNAVTLAIDSTVTTLTGSQTLTNKTLTSATLTSPDVNTPDIDGGTIDGATIATSDVTVGAGKTLDVSAGTLTLADNQISGDKVEGGTIAATTITDLTFGSLNDGTITATAFVDEDNMASNSATLIPTQQSVKAYVDTTVAATNEVVEDTTPQLGGDLDTNGNDILFADSDKAIFGAGSDLQIYHDGSNSFIADVGTGNLGIRAENLFLQNADGSENYATATVNGAFTLSYDNSAKLATTSTGIDVTGTATMDGLTISDSQAGGVTAQIQNSNSTQTGGSRLDFLFSGSTVTGRIQNRFNGGDFQTDWYTGGEGLEIFTDLAKTEKRLDIASNGDISFYEDTGTTAKLFWDASAEGLNLNGTSGLVIDNNAVNGALSITNPSADLIQFTTGTNDDIAFVLSGSEAMRIDSSGNVGIGTSSPLSKLNVKGTQGNWRVDPDSVSGEIQILSTTVANDGFRNFRLRSNESIFETGGTERMRIDSSGKLLVGSTANLGTALLNVAGGIDVAGSDYPYLKLKLAANESIVEANGQYQNMTVGGTGANAYLRFKTADTERMRIDSSGNVGIGTDNPLSILHLGSGADANVPMTIAPSSGGNAEFRNTSSTGSFTFTNSNGSSEKMRIDSSGNVGIGTSNATPSNGEGMCLGSSSTITRLDMRNSTTGDATGDGTSLQLNGNNFTIENREAGYVAFSTSLTERMRIDSSGNVGIGRTPTTVESAYDSLQLGAGGMYLAGSSNLGAGQIGQNFYADTSGNIKYLGNDEAGRITFNNGNITFDNAPTNAGGAGAALTFNERMRIDSSGNVLVGKTGLAIGTVGTEVRNNGQLLVTADGDNPVDLNRLTSDGTIANFRKDGTTVGSIGTTSGYLFVGGTAGSDAFLSFGESGVRPSTSAGAARDAAIDIGGSTNRFKDLYLSGDITSSRFSTDGDGIKMGSGLGIKFDAYASSNILDDYEEGTWTPTVSGGTAGYLVRTGRYTKIGNIVRLRCAIKLNSWSGITTVTVTGIPFSSTTASYDHDWSAAYLPSKPNDKTWVCGVDTSSVFFRQQDSVNGDASLSHSDIDGDTGILFTVTYQVA